MKIRFHEYPVRHNFIANLNITRFILFFLTGRIGQEGVSNRSLGLIFLAGFLLLSAVVLLCYKYCTIE